MRKLMFTLGLFLGGFTYAQNYCVHNVLELQKDLTARRKSVNAPSGKGCSLIRINIPSVKNISFDSSVVGKPEFLPGEYNIYLPEKSDKFSLNVDGETYDVNFADFGIEIEEKKCYRVIFSKKTSVEPQKTKTSIRADYDNVVILIDGKPVGQTPLQIENISLGKHLLSVPNTFGVTMRDTIVDFASVNNINLNLYKEKRKAVFVDIASHGPDTASQYEVFGTNVKEKNGKKGLVDYTGNLLIPYEFDYIFPGPYKDGCYFVVKDGKDGLYKPGEGLVVPCVYEMSEIYFAIGGEDEPITVQTYITVEHNGKQGVISSAGKVVVPIEYESVRFCDDLIIVNYEGVGRKDYYGFRKDYYGFFSYSGDIIMEPRQYDDFADFINGYSIFKRGEDIGLVDIFGKETIIPSNYSVGSLFKNGVMSGLIRVQDKESKKWGYIDTQLNVVIPTIYDRVDGYDIPVFHQGIVLLKQNNNKIILDSKGKIIIDCAKQGYEDLEVVYHRNDDNGSFFRCNDIADSVLVKVKNGVGQYGFLDVKGNIVIPCKYEEDDIQWFTDNGVDYFVLNEDEKIVIRDKQQNELFSLPSNMWVQYIVDGFVKILDRESSSYGYLNTKGEILANCIYGYDTESEELTTGTGVLEEEALGIDIKDVVSWIRPISEGLAILNIGDRYGFIDNKGNIKVPLKYTAVVPFEDGISYGRLDNGKWVKIYKKDL